MSSELGFIDPIPYTEKIFNVDVPTLVQSIDAYTTNMARMNAANRHEVPEQTLNNIMIPFREHWSRGFIRSGSDPELELYHSDDMNDEPPCVIPPPPVLDKPQNGYIQKEIMLYRQVRVIMTQSGSARRSSGFTDGDKRQVNELITRIEVLHSDILANPAVELPDWQPQTVPQSPGDDGIALPQG